MPEAGILHFSPRPLRRMTLRESRDPPAVRATTALLKRGFLNCDFLRHSPIGHCRSGRCRKLQMALSQFYITVIAFYRLRNNSPVSLDLRNDRSVAMPLCDTGGRSGSDLSSDRTEGLCRSGKRVSEARDFLNRSDFVGCESCGTRHANPKEEREPSVNRFGECPAQVERHVSKCALSQ